MKTGNARFDDFIELLLGFETEFNIDGSVKVERDPDDAGGMTKFGIDQRSHPRLDIAALTRDAAIGIYFADWQRLPCDELPLPLGELLMDIHQNGGHGALWLQEALHVTVDGFIGPKTLAAAAQAAANPIVLLRCIHRLGDLRAAYFEGIARRRPKQKKFLRGWMRRNDTLTQWALNQVQPHHDADAH